MNVLKIFFYALMLTSMAHASFLEDSVKMSYSIKAMGRGGAGVAQPYGADALTTNPAGLSQSGSGLHINNLDYSKANTDYRQSTVFHRKSLGLGLWKVESGMDSLETFGLGVARRNRNGVDWGLSYKSHSYVNGAQKSSLWSSDLGVIMHINRSLDIGFVGRDILGSEDRGYSPSIESGILIKTPDASAKIFADVVVNKHQTDYGDAYMRYGLDYALTKDLTLRFGGDQNYYTAGASFDLLFFSVDYAYQSPKNNQKEALVGLGLKIGKAREPESFRRKYALFKPNSMAYLEINGALTSGYSSISLLGGRKIGSNDVIQLINKANHDPDCQGYLLRIKSLEGDLANIALVQEIRNELQKGRALGKKVYVYLDGWAPLPSYYLASVGDVVVMPPFGSIHQLGIPFEVLKFDELMNRFGIRYHLLHSGKYKVSTSAFSDQLSMSQKETITGSLENMMAQLKSDIHQSRNQPLTKNIYDGRIMSAQTAKDLGLIDHIGFWRNMVDIIKEDVKGTDVVLASLGDFREAPSDDYLWSPFNKIAVVEINGAIASGKNRSDVLFGGVQTGSDDIARTFERLSKDPFLQGVIIRINSPGGSVIAADQILDAVNEFKKVSKKPVYASMGTFAASGGYYVALGSDQIFANGATITGSIGVSSGFLNFYEFNKEWGISYESLSTGKYVDAFSPNKVFDDDTKAMILAHQQESYQHFKSLVQESRQLTDDEVNAVSQGQFMTGEEAKSIGLVDEVGSYTDTIEAMEKSLGLKQSRVVVYGRPKMISPFNFLSFLFDQ
tara:strand:- start:11957 stop:14311 length:2355 start_codon:yes stop_codon:yes gene_type:complete